MTVIPTGIDVAAFASAEGAGRRKKLGIPADAMVLGHVGRLAPEKNLTILANAVLAYLRRDAQARFLLVGDGPAREELQAIFEQGGVADRVIFAGKRTGRVLRECYRAMDIFVFTSLSETQGMVVAEAMAAGLPVVALDASGVREVVRDGENGFLLAADATPAEFAHALGKISGDRGLRDRFSNAAQRTAQGFSCEQSARHALAFYEETRRATRARRLMNQLSPWSALVKRLGLEWDLLSTRTQTVAHAVFAEPTTPAKAS